MHEYSTINKTITDNINDIEVIPPVPTIEA